MGPRFQFKSSSYLNSNFPELKTCIYVGIWLDHGASSKDRWCSSFQGSRDRDFTVFRGARFYLFIFQIHLSREMKLLVKAMRRGEPILARRFVNQLMNKIIN